MYAVDFTPFEKRSRFSLLLSKQHTTTGYALQRLAMPLAIPAAVHNLL